MKGGELVRAVVGGVVDILYLGFFGKSQHGGVGLDSVNPAGTGLGNFC